jgi:hypothetical protein
MKGKTPNGGGDNYDGWSVRDMLFAADQMSAEA